jgi:SAM-dependent methyltransferase
MNQFLRGVAQAVSESFHLPEPILEIGSYQVEGQEEILNLRTLFPGKQYTGVDFREGPGVDCVASVENLPHADHSVGTVIAMSVFEHVQRFWLGFEEIKRVLRPDGVFLVATPFSFHVHAYPSDYWRFTPEAIDLMLEPYPFRVLGWHGAARRMSNVWGIAFGAESKLPTESDLEQYASRMKAYARDPLSWSRWLRFQMGRLICGRRPFAPHLDRDRWELDFRGPASPIVKSPQNASKERSVPAIVSDRIRRASKGFRLLGKS